MGKIRNEYVVGIFRVAGSKDIMIKQMSTVVWSSDDASGGPLKSYSDFVSQG